jgi:glycosyltransferase involved in cell wall biosynthesis
VKILHINKSDRTGGAAVAAVRLLDALRKNGTDARMLVLSSEREHEEIEAVVKSGLGRVAQYLRFLGEIFSFIPHEKNRQKRFSFSRGCFGFDISRNPLVQDADVLHLHWINQGFLSLADVRKLIQTGKPIVWTLHDTWAFTGGCHYPGSCGGFTSTCGQCPLIKSPGSNDISARQHAKKERIYENAAVTFVGCSKWMQEMAEKSSLVRKDLNHSVYQVFNPIDTNRFQPGSRASIRQELGLPGDKKLLLFGAANVTDPRKGTDLLLRALKGLFSSEPSLDTDLELVAFGKNVDLLAEKTPFKFHSFDVVAGEQAMAKLYQACDMFVLPSMQDNLPNTVVESMACGTPVVAFDIGGVPEMITHQQSGFLASPGKVQDLAKGIRFVMEHTARLGENARKFAEIHFAPEAIARQYEEIYRSVLKEK